MNRTGARPIVSVLCILATLILIGRPWIALYLLGFVIIAMTIHVRVYNTKKARLFRLFRMIGEKEADNQPSYDEADAAIRILYGNDTIVAEPIYLFASEKKETDLIIIALLRAALRHFNRLIEMEMHGRGFIRMPERDKKEYDIALRNVQMLEKNLAYQGLSPTRRIDKLATECARATRVHKILLQENDKPVPNFHPPFLIVQKTRKDPRRAIFPNPY